MAIEGQLHWLRIACRSICIARLDLNDMVVVEVFRGHLGLVLQLQRVRSAQLALQQLFCVGKSFLQWLWPLRKLVYAVGR